MTTPTPSSTLQLACPTCGGDIEIEYEVHSLGPEVEVLSVRTWCDDDVITLEDAYRLLMDEGARQAELATERAGERG